MPGAADLEFTHTRSVEYRLFQALGENCGIVVTEPETGECAFRFRRDWDDFAGEEAETLRAIAEDLPEKQREMGTARFVEWLDESLSNTFRVEPPRTSFARDLGRTAQALYRMHVRATEKPFVTHLPLLSIRAAAGGFGPDMENRAEAWIEVDEGGRRAYGKEFFVVRIQGRSMEPDIPDGSLCLFRSYFAGSRKGGIFLVQRVTDSETGGEVTIKRYDSEKQPTEVGWRHTQIRMNPENRGEFDAWDLDPEGERYTTVAEFIRVLEDPV